MVLVDTEEPDHHCYFITREKIHETIEAANIVLSYIKQ